MISMPQRKNEKQNGQGIVEYILLITAVIIILLVFLRRGGALQNSYNRIIDMQGNDMHQMTNRIFFDF